MSNIETRGYAHPEVLVSTDWVAAHLNDPSIRIIESNEDTLLYASGHIPGAVNVDWTADLNDQLRRDYITREGFEALMSRIGATNDTTVVFYGDKNNWWACYAFWVFQLFGHTNARVMDGGRIKWEKEKRPVTRDVPSLPENVLQAPMSAPTPSTAPSATKCSRTCRQSGSWSTSAARTSTPACACTCPTIRTRARFAAATSRAPRAFPGRAAINPEDGTFKTADELKKIYVEEKQLSPAQADDCLLPHRRAQQPHLVRAQGPARLREHPQLRRLVDRVGQHGECTD